MNAPDFNNLSKEQKKEYIQGIIKKQRKKVYISSLITAIAAIVFLILMFTLTKYTIVYTINDVQYQLVFSGIQLLVGGSYLPTYIVDGTVTEYPNGPINLNVNYYFILGIIGVIVLLIFLTLLSVFLFLNKKIIYFKYGLLVGIILLVISSSILSFYASNLLKYIPQTDVEIFPSVLFNGYMFNSISVVVTCVTAFFVFISISQINFLNKALTQIEQMPDVTIDNKEEGIDFAGNNFKIDNENVIDVDATKDDTQVKKNVDSSNATNTSSNEKDDGNMFNL